VATLGTQGYRPVTVFTLAGLAFATTIGYFLSRTLYYKIGAFIFVFSSILSAVPLLISAAIEGRPISSSLYSVVPLGFALGFVFLSIRGMFILLILITVMLSVFPSFFPQTSQEIFTDIGNISTLGIVLIIAAVFRNSVERQRLKEVHEINQDLTQLTQNLEQRVDQRTRAIQTAAEVGRRLSTFLEYKILVKEVVEQLQHAFNYYHVHIYLVDPAHQNLVLSGGTGEAAKIMLANSHSIPRGRGLVGRAYDTNKIILISDTSKDRTWLSNPLLPETRSEIAVPISFGDSVLGVLDVQQDVVDSLTQQDADLLQLISSQVGGALRNAQFYEQVQKQIQRELQLNAVVEHIRATNTVDQALKVAVREIGRTLKLSRTAVHLSLVSDESEEDNG
jgi:putative methionine-R-sulfoxide reductase with GAF domain